MKKNFRIVYFVLFISVVFMQAQQGLTGIDKKVETSETYIAVASVSSKESSLISDKAGRAAYFLIFDCNGSFIKAVKNSAQNQTGKASASVTELLKKSRLES